MLGLSPASSAQPKPQLQQYQSQLQQARREAALAQQRVAALEARTEQARRAADEADHRVGRLESQPPRAEHSGSRYITGRVIGALLNVEA